MTDARERLESMPVWIAKTVGYVFLGVFAAIVASNAVQSFFWERTTPAITGGISGAIGALIAVRRRHLLARPGKEDSP